MSMVFTEASMSLDGYIADSNDMVGPLFEWYDNGDVEIRTARPDLTFHVSRPSADHVRAQQERLGAIVCGRRLFDLTDGWGGRQPFDVPVVVVTHEPPTGWDHPDAPFTFVTDGVPSAVEQARKLAGERGVSLTAGTVASQALEAGLLDEVDINLVPAVLGSGRPFFTGVAPTAAFGMPRVVQGDRVTHLYYTVQR
jgi:dihydrofolate reductase